jgi:hypothetical protein
LVFRAEINSNLPSLPLLFPRSSCRRRALHRLENLEALEFGMAEIERLVGTGGVVRGCNRSGRAATRARHDPHRSKIRNIGCAGNAIITVTISTAAILSLVNGVKCRPIGDTA